MTKKFYGRYTTTIGGDDRTTDFKRLLMSGNCFNFDANLNLKEKYVKLIYNLELTSRRLYRTKKMRIRELFPISISKCMLMSGENHVN